MYVKVTRSGFTEQKPRQTNYLCRQGKVSSNVFCVLVENYKIGFVACKMSPLENSSLIRWN